MITFLVDTENISNYSFLENYTLSKDDKLILFITTNSKPIKNLQLINKSNISIMHENVSCGTKNALDFQLITLIFIHKLTYFKTFNLSSF